MTRAWILFSALSISALFKTWRDDYPEKLGFVFSDMMLPIQWWVYFSIEHIIAIAVASCLVIKDNTPKFLLWLFFAINCADMVYYHLFYRDKGVGFNLAKAIVFGLPLLYLETRNQWTHLKRFINQE